jgi:hypothetical protein
MSLVSQADLLISVHPSIEEGIAKALDNFVSHQYLAKYDNLYEHYDIDAPHVLYVLHDVCLIMMI